MTEVQRFPTGNDLIDQLCHFSAARLKSIFGPYPEAHGGKPSLAEDWWAQDQMARNVSFPIEGMDRETGLRICYRWARNRNVERAVVGAPFVDSAAAADLLLHQMSELMPTMFHAARTIFEDQAKAKGGAA